jgi:drug/metabolite transporter (DMT)-like permease
MFGLLAASGWGLADFYIAVLGRRIGWFRATVGMGIAAAVLITTLFFILRPAVGIAPRDWLVLVALAIGTVPLLFAFYKALEEGPLAIVTPVVTAYAAIVVLLSLLILGERLNAGQWTGVSLAIGGVALASMDLRRIIPGESRVGLGVWLGIASMFGFGVSAFIGGFYAQRYGWLVPTFFVRIMVSGLILLIASATKQWPWQRAGPRWLALLAFVGALEFAGYLAFVRGAEVGFVSIVAASSAAYPLIPLIMGLIVFRERLAPNQGVGIFAALAAVILLALSG